MCAPKRFLRRGTSTRVPHILERKARTRNARSVQRRERERERERGTERDERQRSLVVLVVRRKRRSLLFFDRKKKKKWNKIVSAIDWNFGRWGKTYLSDHLSIGCVYCVVRDRESREREDEKPVLSTKGREV